MNNYLSDDEQKEYRDRFFSTLLARSFDLRESLKRKSEAAKRLRAAQSDVESHVRAIADLTYHPSSFSLESDVDGSVHVWKGEQFGGSVEIWPGVKFPADSNRRDGSRRYYDGWEHEFLEHQQPTDQAVNGIRVSLEREISKLRAVLHRTRTYMRSHFSNHKCDCDICNMQTGPKAKIDSVLADIDTLLGGNDGDL